MGTQMVALASEGSMSQTILNNIVTFLLPVVGIAMVVFIVVVAIGLHKGAESASWKKLIIGVLAFLIIGALLVLAKNFSSTADTVSKTVETYGKDVQQEADKLIK